MFTWLNGKKTYLVALAAILMYIANWFQAGVYDWSSFIALLQELVPAIIGMTVRHGISKNV